MKPRYQSRHQAHVKGMLVPVILAGVFGGLLRQQYLGTPASLHLVPAQAAAQAPQVAAQDLYPVPTAPPPVTGVVTTQDPPVYVGIVTSEPDTETPESDD